MVTIIGVDHVGIGTDTKLTPSYRPPGAQNGSGGGQNRGRIDERTNEAWQDQTVRFFYAVVDSLLQVGFFEDEIGKEGGDNFCRVSNEVTAGHH
jgi:membrane dipeptidase